MLFNKNYACLLLFMIFAAGCEKSYAPVGPAAAASAATAKAPGLLNDFESFETFNYLGGTNVAEPAVAEADGSFIFTRFETGNPLPGGTPGAGLRLMGKANSYVTRYRFRLPLDFNIDSAAVNGRFSFAYKASASSVGKAFYIRFTHQLTDYSWYEFMVIPADQSWTQVQAYMPGKGGFHWNSGFAWNGARPWSYGPCQSAGWPAGGNEFARPCWGGNAPNGDWNTIKASIVDIYIDMVPPEAPAPATPTDFDIVFDDLRFE